MDLKHYSRILWRRTPLIAITMAVTVSVIALGTQLMAPTYMASAQVRVTVILGNETGYIDDTYIERLMNTYIELATSGPVISELAHRLDLSSIPPIKVASVPGTELIGIQVEDTDPQRAAQVANTLAEILITQSQRFYSGGDRTATRILQEQLVRAEQELEQSRRAYHELLSSQQSDADQVADASQSLSLKEEAYASLLGQYEEARVIEALQANALSLTEPATAPQAPTRSLKQMSLILGSVVGLAGGVGLAFAVENLDTTLYDTEQIKEVTTMPLLAQVPTASQRRALGYLDPDAPQAQAFRHLYMRLSALECLAKSRILIVTSAQSREGKTTVVLNLAAVLAEFGHRVVIVDANMQRPALHRALNLDNEVGLGSVLQSQVTIEDALQTCTIPGVHVLTSGPVIEHPAKALATPQMAAVLEYLSQRFDLVLLDSSALMAAADAAILAKLVNGVLLVVGRTRVRRDMVQEACEQLKGIGCDPIGLVVNWSESKAERGDTERKATHRSKDQAKEQEQETQPDTTRTDVAAGHK